MNRLSIQQRVQVINALVEGNSIRATCRITDTAKGTVLRLLAEVGAACAARRPAFAASPTATPPLAFAPSLA